MHSVWDKIDGILVVNLDSCAERMVEFKRRHAEVLPMDKVHRLSAVYGRELPTYGKAPWFTERTGERAKYWGGAAGCVLSHRNAIARAQQEGWRHVLILEDDAQVLADSEGLELLEQALSALRGPYILYPGYSRPTPYGRKLRSCGRHGLWKIEGVLSTFGYIVSQDMYAPLLAALPTDEGIWDWMSRHRAIDTFYRDTAAHMPGVGIYCIQPDIIAHIDGESSIGSDTRTDRYSLTQEPLSYASLSGVLHGLAAPFRRLKIRLNGIRTHRRAVRGGFPGYRKKKK